MRPGRGGTADPAQGRRGQDAAELADSTGLTLKTGYGGPGRPNCSSRTAQDNNTVAVGALACVTIH